MTEPAKELTPPDRNRCQCDKPGNGPFTMGGAIGDPKNGYRVRCENKPTVIVTEREPGEDGLRGSMALCDGCLAVLHKQRGEEFADVEKILRLPFTLPDEPVDKYRVEWWKVDSTFGISHRAAVYHINSTWAEICPDDADQQGAPFVNDWQCFDGDYFTGRNTGWHDGWSHYEWRNCFATKREALVAWVEILEARRVRLQEDVVAVDAKLGEAQEMRRHLERSHE